MRNIALAIAIIILVPLVFTGKTSVPSNNVAAVEASSQISVNAEALMAEFAANEDLARAKYAGKNIKITGIISEKASPKDNIPKTDASYVIFGDYEKTGLCIQCYFDTVVVLNLKVGDELVVSGNMIEVEHVTDNWKIIVLKQCQIEK